MRHDDYHIILGKLWESYFQDQDTRKNLRFGQYVINSDQLAEVVKTPLPELFYEGNNQTALAFLLILGADLS